jgi:Uma2 family endonuclease
MTAPKREIATYEDLLRVPEHLVAELVDGELYTWPRPRLRHARAAGRLFGRIERAFDSGDDGPGGWLIVFEPELRLHNDALIPDIAGWRAGREPVDPDASRIDIAPDWVCEVLSPSTRSFDRVKKMAVYARHGVEYAWLLDPLDRTLEVKRLVGGRWTDMATFDEGVVRAEPFDAIEIDLISIWGGPPPVSPLSAP